MLTHLLRRWFAPRLPAHAAMPMCLPEWSATMAELHASIWWKVKRYTTASTERVVALCQSVAYLEKHQIAGDIVVCGVARGGSIMAAALALLGLDSTQRQFQLYDISPKSDVKQALMQTRYPWEKIQFIPGRAEAAIPRHLPDEIALLLLDAGASESTHHTLAHFYPRLVDGGVLLLAGQPHEVDQYFHDHRIATQLRTIDDTARLLVKQSQSASLAA